MRKEAERKAFREKQRRAAAVAQRYFHDVSIFMPLSLTPLLLITLCRHACRLSALLFDA